MISVHDKKLKCAKRAIEIGTDPLETSGQERRIKAPAAMFHGDLCQSLLRASRSSIFFRVQRGLIYVLLFFMLQLEAIEKYFKPVPDKSSMHSIPQVDCIYMINLDERPEKWQNSLAVLRPYEIVPCRFSAVNGWKLSFQAIDELGVIYMPGMSEGPLSTVFRHEEGKEYMGFEIMQEPGVAYYCHSFTRGAIGCILSHLSVLQDAYNEGHKTIWIMEDDIRVVADPRRLSSLIVQLDQVAPGWDVFFTDNEIKGAHGEPVYCRGILPRPLVRLESLSYYQQRIDVHPDMIRLGLRYGSHSMIISQSGVVKILEYFKKNKIFFPYDLDYCFIPGIQMYQCKYDIVTNIAGGPSDLGTPSYEKQSS